MSAPARLAQPPGMPASQGASLSRALLAWYDRERRDLPWRTPPGGTADPYRVWLSEIMLQQTTVKAVAPYFAAFLARWPTVEALARAPRADVLSAWAGLGYYSRAHRLHECAGIVAGKLGGRFPEDPHALEQLPGIGPYTAAAIAAIAFGARAMPVDGNVERVVARLFQVETPLPAAKPELRALAETLTPRSRTGDFAQAMMDLGATICTPRRPSCMLCPLARACLAHQEGCAAQLPVRTRRPEKPLRHGVAFVALSERGQVLLRRRPDKGLLAGMMEVPSTEWMQEWLPAEEALRAAGFLAAVFFLSDLTATDFVRVDRTGVFGASVLLLTFGRSVAREMTIPSAHCDLEAKCHAIPKPVLPWTAWSRHDSIRDNQVSIIWFTA